MASVCVSCLAVRILRQYERQAARKTDDVERTRREIQGERKEMETGKKLHKVDFRKQTGALGDVPHVLIWAGSVPDQCWCSSTDVRAHEISNCKF